MRARSYTNDQLILAARFYVLDGLSQAQVGKLVHVSQSKVSRMLALARERGIVRVTVPAYEPLVSLGLNELRLIPKRVCVSAVSDRAAVILAALLRGGLLNALVIDERCAAARIEKAS